MRKKDRSSRSWTKARWSDNTNDGITVKEARVAAQRLSQAALDRAETRLLVASI